MGTALLYYGETRYRKMLVPDQLCSNRLHSRQHDDETIISDCTSLLGRHDKQRSVLISIESINRININTNKHDSGNRLCGLAVRVPGYRSRGPGSILGAARFSEKSWAWNGVHSAS
jgi:hypothetical protein